MLRLKACTTTPDRDSTFNKLDLMHTRNADSSNGLTEANENVQKVDGEPELRLRSSWEATGQGDLSALCWVTLDSVREAGEFLKHWGCESSAVSMLPHKLVCALEHWIHLALDLAS